VFYKHDNLIENINTLESGDNAWFNKITQNIIKAVPSNMDDEFVFDEFSNELFAIFENLDFNDNYCKNIIEIDNNGIFFETECMSKTLKLNKICKDGVFMNFLYF
jgi:hypothetical protein